MDSLIFELQIVFYFQLFLSVNVRHNYNIEKLSHLQFPFFSFYLKTTNLWLCNERSVNKSAGCFASCGNTVWISFKRTYKEYPPSPLPLGQYDACIEPHGSTG